MVRNFISVHILIMSALVQQCWVKNKLNNFLKHKNSIGFFIRILDLNLYIFIVLIVYMPHSLHVALVTSHLFYFLDRQ